jgi:hypothetical protein
VTPTPEVLLTEARRLLDSRSSDLRGTWPRAVALLTRQALEETLDDLWRWKAPGAQLASRRAQLLCLGPYVGDETLARQVRYAWVMLSRACHHHPFEVCTVADSLSDAAKLTEQFRQALKRLPG